MGRFDSSVSVIVEADIVDVMSIVFVVNPAVSCIDPLTDEYTVMMGFEETLNANSVPGKESCTAE